MMSSENIPPPSQPPDHNPHSGASRKAASSSQKTTQEPPQAPPPHPSKCPRCDSANTKFCYYNNYSLTQPRHFCKTCRRYWTKGGALRNVPIGGGCRKTKKLKPNTNTTTTSSSLSPSSEFRFLPTPPAAAFEFQLGGLSLTRLHPATAGVYTHFIASSTGAHPQQPPHPTGGGCFSLDLLGLGNYPPAVPNSGNSSSTNSSLSLAGGGGGGDHTLTISSIESLSTINQEMHWKLQQQRLALIYGPSSSGMEHDDDDDNNNNNNNQQEKTTLIGGGGGGGGGIQLFKNVETTTAKKVEGVAGVGGPTLLCSHPAPTEWLFDQIQPNYGVITTTDTTNTTTNYNNNNNNNKYDDFNGVWTTQLHHHHHHHFSGLQ